jgi:galactarate dehydratase (D-threo-forming)
MKITRIETYQIETPRYYGYVSGHVIVKIHTDESLIGLGEASDSRAKDIGAVAAQYNELLVGRDATAITEINELIRGHRFNSSVSDMHLTSAIDIGLWDLNGKAMGVPAWRLMGGKMRDKVYCCYPIFGWQVQDDFEQAASYLQRLTDLGHHLFRYYVSGDSALDDRFLTEMKTRFGDRIKLKSIDLSHRFKDWESGIRYADVLRHHNPFHFEGPSQSMRINAEFSKRVDLPVSEHIYSYEQGHEAVERGSCTIFNVACITYGPTYIRRLIDLAECTGLKYLIGTDQESTLGIAAQLSVAATAPNLAYPCDPMGPVLYTTSPAKERIRAEGSYLYLPEGPGLGVELDEEKMQGMTIATA